MLRKGRRKMTLGRPAGRVRPRAKSIEARPGSEVAKRAGRRKTAGNLKAQ